MPMSIEDIKKHKAPPPVADINVTPMVDVMLVMLIIFMVITPMLTKGKDVDMVKTKNAIAMQAADKTDAIICAVTRDGKTYLNITQMEPADMPQRVKELLENRPTDKTSSSRPTTAPSTSAWSKWWTTCARWAWTSSVC